MVVTPAGAVHVPRRVKLVVIYIDGMGAIPKPLLPN
jgi:hypothetical protein